MKKRKTWLLLFIICILAPLFVSCAPKSAEELPPQSAAPAEPENSPSAEAQSAAAQPVQLSRSARELAGYGILDAASYMNSPYLSRIEAARLAADVTGLSKEAQNGVYTHPFVDISAQSQQVMGLLYQKGIVEGVSNNHFMGDEICDRSTFLVFLLRAMNCVGGVKEEITWNNAQSAASQKGILPEDAEDGSMLTVDEAFELSCGALFSQINESGETLFSYLAQKGIAKAPDALGYDEAYQIASTVGAPFFRETFDDKRLDGKYIKDEYGTALWYGSDVKGIDNSLTDDGYLQLSGKDQGLIYDQQFVLDKSLMQGSESYGMTFTVNVQRMANEGNEGRVVFRVIPRSADEDVSRYYAVNYFMVLPLGNYQSNLARCKWSITNTNAPSGTEPLAEAYFLLKENVDYTARLLIENTANGNVHIAFYIDGPDRFAQGHEPLLEYTDASDYKILKSATGPALGTSGYQGFAWGFASTVRFDDIALYDVQNFAAQTAQLKAYADTPVLLNESGAYATQLQYLVDRGILTPYQRNVEFAGNVSVAQFLASAMYLNGEYMREGQTLDAFTKEKYQLLFEGTPAETKLDLGRAITRYEAAVIIKNMLRGKPPTSKYRSLYQDALDAAYRDAVDFAVQNSYLLLDENRGFNGEALLTRHDLARIFCCAVDPSLRCVNYPLQVPSVYTNNAVLQGGKPLPIRGRGMSGDTVTVTFHDQTKTANVVDGQWRVELDSEEYGGPYTLTVKDSGFTYSYENIYVGEVFVVAGQSNAEMSLYDSDDNADTLQVLSNQSRVRLFRPQSHVATTPVQYAAAVWETAGNQYSEYVFGTASAVGAFYVQKLTELNSGLDGVRIGLIQLTYGGTSIEMFLPDCVCEKNNLTQDDDACITSGFWNGYMDDVTPFAARALIYYQGENSAQLGYMYEPMLRDYIWGIRQKFNDASLPVMLVQLAGYGDNYGQEGDTWPYIREIQMRVANTMQNVGLVSAIDLSDADPYNIHPVYKRPIGERLAYLAMDLVYGEDYGKQSSRLMGYTLSDGVYTLTFDAQSLSLNENAFGKRAFEVLTPEGKWVDAKAKIEGNTLLVWADNVVLPNGVRYAWANYPKASLMDQNGLPVLPFNTTKDLYTAPDADSYRTNAHRLVSAYHLLERGDAVVNVTKNGALRYVSPVNAYVLEYIGEDIEGQRPGDKVILLKKQAGFVCEKGTTETVVKFTAHGLKAGDFVRNTKYDVFSEVLEVIDANTLRVTEVKGQASGDLMEVFRNLDTVTAE